MKFIEKLVMINIFKVIYLSFCVIVILLFNKYKCIIFSRYLSFYFYIKILLIFSFIIFDYIKITKFNHFIFIYIL